MQRSDNEVLSKKKIISEKTDLVIQDVARSSNRVQDIGPVWLVASLRHNAVACSPFWCRIPVSNIWQSVA
jgi:hypothetical protein